MRALVTGAGGMLGRALVAALRRDGQSVVGLDRASLDITDRAAVSATVREIAPTVIFNCAAYTKVDQAESEPDAAFAVNAAGPLRLAEAAAERGALLVHLSTDYVFDGYHPEPNPEWLAVAPLSVYGRSKALGERWLAARCPHHLIVRTQWLFGVGGPNFIDTILRLAAERSVLSVVSDQHGCPTYVPDLADGLLRLVEAGAGGIVHLTNQGRTTWHGLASYVLRRTGNPATVRAVSTADFPRPAARPPNGVLAPMGLRALGLPLLRPWEEAVDAYLLARAPSSTEVCS